jgi:hypothetical protein
VAFRLAEGELTTDRIEQGRARLAYLITTRVLYPECWDELRELAAGLRSDLSDDWAWGDPDSPDRAQLEAWCRKWGLMYRGAVAPWALEVARDTVWMLQQHPKSATWMVSYGGGVPSAEATRLPDGTIFNPAGETLASAKRRVSRGERARLREIVEETLRAGSFRRAKTKREPELVELAVRYVSGRERLGSFEVAHQMRVEISRVLRLLPLGKQSGRPRKPAR